MQATTMPMPMPLLRITLHELSNADIVPILDAHQAKHMVTRSHAALRAGSIGDNVAVPIPIVDKRRGDHRNSLGVIMAVTDKNQYKIAVKYGVLKGHYSRNQFDLCPQKLLTMNDVNTAGNTESMISLTEAVARQSASVDKDS